MHVFYILHGPPNIYYMLRTPTRSGAGLVLTNYSVNLILNIRPGRVRARRTARMCVCVPACGVAYMYDFVGFCLHTHTRHNAAAAACACARAD